MKVYETKRLPQLLVGSYNGGGLGYIPGQPSDNTLMA